MEEFSEEDLEDAIETRFEIAHAESDQFIKRWKDERFAVPVELIDFHGIHALLENETDLLDNVSSPLVLTEELKTILGDLAEVFVDYVNSSRKSLALQGLSVFSNLGYLEPGIDEAGNLGYTRTTKQASGLVSDAIEKALKIHERF